MISRVKSQPLLLPSCQPLSMVPINSRTDPSDPSSPPSHQSRGPLAVSIMLVSSEKYSNFELRTIERTLRDKNCFDFLGHHTNIQSGYNAKCDDKEVFQSPSPLLVYCDND
jgi:hypothetical protein